MVCGGLYSPVICYILDYVISVLIGVQILGTLSISHWLMCTRMFLNLLFSPSACGLLRKRIKYRLICSTFYWDQTQFHISSTSAWLFFVWYWSWRGCSSYLENLEDLQSFPVSHIFCLFLCLLVKFCRAF